MAAGSALAAAVTGAGTESADLMITGLIAGAAVGAAQAPLLTRGLLASAAWTAVVGRDLVARLARRPPASSSTPTAATPSSAPAAPCWSTVLTGLALHRILAAPRPLTGAAPATA